MSSEYLLSSYDYNLPQENIAQYPVKIRDRSKLMVFDSSTNSVTHSRFDQLTELLDKNDLLVVNNSKVFPARFLGRKETGGKIEMFFLHYPEPAEKTERDKDGWSMATVTALLKSSKRPKNKTGLFFSEELRATVDGFDVDSRVRLTLYYRSDKPLLKILYENGQTPLPPYISRPNGPTSEDKERYQTMYAHQTGSVAAPTAGLHFSDELLKKIMQMGIPVAAITLHVGYSTFSPVRTKDIRDHKIHSEYVEVSTETARLVNKTRERGGRIWAVGTTTVRALEYATDRKKIQAVKGFCDLYIYPGYEFQTVDNLITNFHLPGSSLLFLVSAFAGRKHILSCYQTAIDMGYRFYSYGDAMAIIRR